MIEAATLTLAYILDLAIGDPKQFPHPVRMMGWAITRVEYLLRRREQSTEIGQKLAGIFLVLIIVASTYVLFYGINFILHNFQFSTFANYLSLLLLAYLISTTLATRELLKSAKSVIETLKNNNIEGARANLSCIVGRDTNSLDRHKILKVTIESLAENASDGIIAPLFYFSIGGLPLAMTYKAINTLDSMIGHRNEKYRNFGWAAAKLDDIANYLPARITGVLIAVSTCIIDGLNGLNAFKIMLRDGRNHLSPNSGIPEAAMAGALGIRLGGQSFYEGTIVEKPYIGEERQNAPADSERIWTRGQTERPEKLPKSFATRQVRNGTGGAQITEAFYLKAFQKSITITRITSLLGFSSALVLIYIRLSI